MENNPSPTSAGPAASAGTAPAPDPANGAAPPAAARFVEEAVGNTAAGGRGRVRVRRRVVVCLGVRGVFAPDAGGVWRLANGAELRVLEGLGGSKTGIGRLRGLDAALEAQLAGPGDLRLLAQCFALLVDRYRSAAMVAASLEADGLLAAFTVVCSVVDEYDAAVWLGWALAARMQPNLTGALGVGAGWECWEALTRSQWAGDRWGQDFCDGLGDGFWERVRSHPNEMVREAAAAGDPQARRGVLRRAASPELAPEVLDIAASHPRISGWALWRLFRVERYQHTWRIAQNKSAPRWALHLIARGRTHAGYGWAHSRACWMLAQNPAAGRWTLGRLAGAEDWAARSWVAYNPRAGRRTLRRLASDGHWWVRRCVAQNPAAPRRLVEHLAFDGRREVRSDAAANPKLPGRLAEQLAGDRAQMVRAAVARRPGLPAGLVERLAEDPSPIVRAAVAAREGLPAAQSERLACDPHVRVRKAAASNPGCPPGVLERLAEDPSRQVRLLAAAHPACPPQALSRLAGDTPQVRLEAAANPECPPQALSRLAGDKDRWVRQLAAYNPECPPHELARLACDRNRFVRADAAANPNCPEPALERLSVDGRYLVFSAARETLAQRRQDRGADPPGTQEPLAGPKQPSTSADSAADRHSDNAEDETEHLREGEGRCPS
ncbi:MAG: hypothetical protein OXI32_09470 [bacterium]|nr:hypothetical protein [bacterium]